MAGSQKALDKHFERVGKEPGHSPLDEKVSDDEDPQADRDEQDSRWKTLDFYEVLKLEPSATSSDIKKGFRKVALTCHPDKVLAEQKAEATRRFQLIAEAYDVLSKDDLRARYDAARGLTRREGAPSPKPKPAPKTRFSKFKEQTDGAAAAAAAARVAAKSKPEPATASSPSTAAPRFETPQRTCLPALTACRSPPLVLVEPPVPTEAADMTESRPMKGCEVCGKELRGADEACRCGRRLCAACLDSGGCHRCRMAAADGVFAAPVHPKFAEDDYEAEDEHEAHSPSDDEEEPLAMLDILLAMGFEPARAKAAVRRSTSVMEAMEALMEASGAAEDADVLDQAWGWIKSLVADDASDITAKRRRDLYEQLLALGFSIADSRCAVARCSSVEGAVEFLTGNAEGSPDASPAKALSDGSPTRDSPAASLKQQVTDIECPMCRGSGKDSIGLSCFDCRGTGAVKMSAPDKAELRQQLLDLGFPKDRIDAALQRSSTLEGALNWLESAR